MDIKIVENSISRIELEVMAGVQFGDYVKAVVDIEKEIAAFGGGMHADEEAELLVYGSAQKNLWGINIYPAKSHGEWIEFDSMINIRPVDGNRSRGVEDKEIQSKIRKIIDKLVIEK